MRCICGRHQNLTAEALTIMTAPSASASRSPSPKPIANPSVQALDMPQHRLPEENLHQSRWLGPRKTAIWVPSERILHGGNNIGHTRARSNKDNAGLSWIPGITLSRVTGALYMFGNGKIEMLGILDCIEHEKNSTSWATVPGSWDSRSCFESQEHAPQT